MKTFVQLELTVQHTLQRLLVIPITFNFGPKLLEKTTVKCSLITSGMLAYNYDRCQMDTINKV